MAAIKPRRLEDFRGIKGVGERKLQDLCPEFLAVIQNHSPA